MVDRPPSSASAERHLSQIPLPTNKRSSMSLNSVLQQANMNAASPARTSPPIVGPVPPGKKSPRSTKRQSLLVAPSASRKSTSAAPLDIGQEDPAHLKAQIALLQSSLYASHQRIMDLTADMNLDTSITSSPPSALLRPYTPVNGIESEAFTPMTDASTVLEEDDEYDGLENGGPSIPKSKSTYDLSGNAATPGRDGQPQPQVRKTSDGPGISRIPRASVAHARLMHDASPGASPQEPRPPNGIRSHTLTSPAGPSHLRSPFAANLESPYSPATSIDGRLSPNPEPKRSPLLGSAASTKVIDGLQTELINTKGHIEKLKQEMRSNQRLIGSLTRQSEDLKETKERMKVEVEGLNNVISRKERLLQEVLERARSAEASLAEHLGHKKALEESAKKSVAEMTSQMKEAQLARAKAESESSNLRDGVRSLKDAWTREVKVIKEEMRIAEENGRKERDEANQKHQQLVKLVKAQSGERANIQRLAAETAQQTEAANVKFQTHISELRTELDRTTRENKEANKTAADLAAELVRLRRLMREPRRTSLDEATTNNDLVTTA